MKNIKHTELNATLLYKEGRAKEQKAHADAEVNKVGTLRGGSSGCVIANGDVYGTCPRVALARYKGHQAPIEPLSFEWFDAGFANEDAWLQKLKNLDYTLKAEEECPIEWTTDRGVKVTGRPDIILFDNEEPVLGLELKAVCAVNAAVNIYCKDEPKIENLLQAAHYSMIKECPFILVYSYRSRSVVPGWAFRYNDKLRLAYEKTTISKAGKPYKSWKCTSCAWWAYEDKWSPPVEDGVQAVKDAFPDTGDPNEGDIPDLFDG